MEPLITWLLELPNGIRFRKFGFRWDREKDIQRVMNWCTRVLAPLNTPISNPESIVSCAIAQFLQQTRQHVEGLLPETAKGGITIPAVSPG